MMDNYWCDAIENQELSSLFQIIDVNDLCILDTQPVDNNENRHLSVENCRLDLVKTTLNQIIIKRRKSRGLGDIDLSAEKKKPLVKYIPTPEDQKRNDERKNRNRIAARKCRQNQKEKNLKLNEDLENLTSINIKLKSEKNQLEQEYSRLERILSEIRPSCLNLVSTENQRYQQYFYETLY